MEPKLGTGAARLFQRMWYGATAKSSRMLTKAEALAQLHAYLQQKLQRSESEQLVLSDSTRYLQDLSVRYRDQLSVAAQTVVAVTLAVGIVALAAAETPTACCTCGPSCGGCTCDGSPTTTFEQALNELDADSSNGPVDFGGCALAWSDDLLS